MNNGNYFEATGFSNLDDVQLLNNRTLYLS